MLYGEHKLWVTLQKCSSLTVWENQIKRTLKNREINNKGHNRKRNINFSLIL